MSDRPTPETDAELHGINAVCKEDRKLDAMTSHARKLERERDEARDQADKYLAILKKHNLDQHGN